MCISFFLIFKSILISSEALTAILFEMHLFPRNQFQSMDLKYAFEWI